MRSFGVSIVAIASGLRPGAFGFCCMDSPPCADFRECQVFLGSTWAQLTTPASCTSQRMREEARSSEDRLYFSKVANRVVAIGVLEHRSRKVRAPLGALPGNA